MLWTYPVRGLSDFAVGLSHGALGSHRRTSHQSQVWNLLSPSCLSRPIVPWYLGISQQSQVWDMLRPSCPSYPIISRYLGISWDVPPVPAVALALALALAQTLVGCCMGSKGTMELWDGVDKRDKVCVPDLGRWDVPWDPNALWDTKVPVDVLQQSWTTMSI